MTEPLPSLQELGEQFERLAYAERRRSGARGSRRLVLLAVLGATLIAAAAALAASGVLRGAPVRNPPGVRFDPNSGPGAPVAHGTRLYGLRVADPAGGPPWGLRRVTTTRDLGCLQIGRVVDGRLGVLGKDGAFHDDGRFHERGPGVVQQTDCQQPDGAGNVFIAISYQGLPASASAYGCAVEPNPRRRDRRPACPPQDMRVLYYGLLGPQGQSITYRKRDGQRVTIATAGPDGAYLVVMTPRPGQRLGGYVPSSSPLSGLERITYRDGTVCRLQSPQRLGGARPCPLKGYVRPDRPQLRRADVAAPVQARLLPKPVHPVSQQRPWKLVVTFRARVDADAQSYYKVFLTLPGGRRCAGGESVPIDHDVTVGQIVRTQFLLARSCRGQVHGQVAYRPQPSRPDQLPFTSAPGDGLVVGAFSARIP